MNYDVFLGRLDGVRPSGGGHVARCPGHDDKTASLSVAPGEGGRILVKCHAGCEPAVVVGALGLGLADLFDRDAAETPDAPEWDPKADGFDVAARYRYVDADGALVFEKERRVPKRSHPAHGHAKTFTVRRPDPDRPSRWLYNLTGTPRPLYRLPDVRAAVEAGRTVVVVEGEKDVDRLAALGLVATTCDGGAGKWGEGHTEALRGARVAVLPDNDAAGRAHARAVAGALAGVAAEVRLLTLGTLQDGRAMPVRGDVSDWLDAGGTAEGLRALIRETAEYRREVSAADGALGGGADGPFTVADLARELGTRTALDAEDTASQLAARAATAAPAELAAMGSELERRGARVRWVREWTGNVRAQAKADAQTKAEGERAAKVAGAPKGLRGGALNAWLADRLLAETGGFACDPGGALYRYDAAHGRYVPCERWVGARVRAILTEAGAMESFGEARTKAVAYDLATRADALWTSPPKDRLCVLNGVLDLASGKIEPHRAGLWLSTRGLPITYDPAAGTDAQAWRDYFESVLPADAPPGWGFELLRWLLAPASGKRPAVLLFGAGDDGKSTFLGLLTDVLGGAAGGAVAAVPLQVLASDRFALADLFGAVLNVCADLPDEPLGGADVFKRITGGDLVRAERKYGDGFHFNPHAHLLFSSNHPVRLKSAGADKAFWGRWLVIPFGGDFGEGSPDRRSVDELRAELLGPAALSSLLNAALSCSAEGEPPDPSPSMSDALDAMRRGVRPAVPLPAGHGDGATSDPADASLAAVDAPSHNYSNAKERDTPPGACPNGRDLKSCGDEPAQPTPAGPERGDGEDSF